MQQFETATKSQAKHAPDTCSGKKITCSTKTHTRECKSRACNLITASGKQVSNGLRQEHHRTYLSKRQAGIQVIFKLWRYPNPTFPTLLQSIQTPPFQYCCKVSKPLSFQYCFKVSKPCLYNILSRYPNPTFPILFQGIQTPIFPILFQGIQTLPLQYTFKVSKHHLSNIVSRYPNPSFPILFQDIQPPLSNIVSRHPNLAFPLLFQGIQTLPFQ